MAVQLSPQPRAVGETIKNINLTSSYAALLENKQTGQVPAKLELKQVEFVHGEATIRFTMEEVHQYAKEEGLHQALVIKFSQDQYDMQDIRKLLPKQFGTQGHCRIGWLARRHVFIRFDRHDDYVLAAAKSVNYLAVNGRELQMRIFPWTISFNPKEETSKAFVWMSFPGLPPMLFAKQSLLSIASAAGKPLAIDKATQEKSRPSTARVKVELDLLGNLPQNLRIKFVDEKTGKVIEHVQKFVYDNLPLYCTCCKRQGHDVTTCRSISTKTRDSELNGDFEEADDSTIVEKFQGDLRQKLNEKRRLHGVIEATTIYGPKEALTDANIPDGLNNSGISKNGAIVNVDHALARMSQAMAIEAGDKVLKDRGNGSGIVKLAGGDRPTIATGEQADNAASYKTNDEGHTHVGVEALEYADATSSQAVNVQNPAGGVHANTGALKPTAAMKHSVDQAVKIPATVGSNLKAAVVLNANVDQAASNIGNIDVVAHVELEKNSIQQIMDDGALASDILEIKNNAAVAGAQFGTSTVLAACLDASTVIGSGVEAESQHVQQSQAKGWSVVHRSPSKKVDSDLKKLERATETFKCSNSFDALISVHEQGEKDSTNILQLVQGNTSVKDRKNRPPGSVTEQQIAKANELYLGTSKEIVPTADFENNLLEDLTTKKAHSTNTPTFHLSSPQVEKIINDAQNAMAVHTTMVKQPLVTLNTSVFEIPSQSLESFGEYGGESGQLMLSTGNNNEIIQANVREIAIKSKLWADQREDDDDEDTGADFARDSTDEGERCSGDEEMISVGSPLPKTGSSSKVNSGSKLNAKAPNFIPKNRQQPITTESGQQHHMSNTPAAICATEHHEAATLNPVNQQQIVTMPKQIEAATTPRQQQQDVGSSEAVIASRNIEQQQQNLVIGVEDRKLLDALVCSKPLNSLNLNAYSTGRVGKNRNKMKYIDLQQQKAALVGQRQQDGDALIAQGLGHDMPNPVKLGRDIYEDGEEDELLNRCREDAARKGDLSPMHSGKKKKTHKREKSWDDKVSEAANIRQLPTRVAKQKQVLPTTSTKSNRSKKKA